MKQKSQEQKPCQLCGMDRELAKSHVIPEFMYKRLRHARLKMPIHSMVENRQISLSPSGIYEKLLCEECEKFISYFESYAAPIINDDQIPFLIEHQPGRKTLSNIDYKKLKIFFLSLLWRASISKHYFFRGIDLAEKEKALKHLILSSDPESEDKYSVAMVGILDDAGALLRMTLEPSLAKIKGEGVAIFLIAGYIYLISVKKISRIEIFKLFGLKESGTMVVNYVQGDEAKEWLWAIGVQVAKYPNLLKGRRMITIVFETPTKFDISISE